MWRHFCGCWYRSISSERVATDANHTLENGCIDDTGKQYITCGWHDWVIEHAQNQQIHDDEAEIPHKHNLEGCKRDGWDLLSCISLLFLVHQSGDASYCSEYDQYEGQVDQHVKEVDWVLDTAEAIVLDSLNSCFVKVMEIVIANRIEVVESDPAKLGTKQVNQVVSEWHVDEQQHSHNLEHLK